MRANRLLLLLAGLLAIGLAHPVRAAGPFELSVSYSADSEIGVAPNARAGKLWRTPQMLRHEGVENGRQQVVIARLDRQIAWLMAPAMNIALETDLTSLGSLPALIAGGDKVKQTVAGTETIDGLATTKYRIETVGVDAGKFNGFIWSTAQGVVVRIDGQGEYGGRAGAVQLRFRNIRMGAQDASLFEPPANFNRMKVNADQIETLLRGLEQMNRLRGGPAN